MPDAREQAEAVARWCGWIYDPSRPFDMRWQAPRGDLVDAAPPYWRSRDLMEPVEDEIERRGLEREYVCAVAAIAKIDASRMFPWLRVTALQRLAAAARVIEEVGK